MILTASRRRGADSSHLHDVPRRYQESTGPELRTTWKEAAVDYTDRLRRLAINDERLAEDGLDALGVGVVALDAKSLALARIAALVAVGGAEPSFGSQADAAVSVGATPSEIVDVLVGIIPVVGLPRVVAAAPMVAMALGHDIDDAFDDAGVARGD
jgi:4-carboxymuconolactone decarboxylase